MSGQVPPGKVPCTFLGCDFAFNSVKEMIKHKVITPSHDYCSKCDEDFEDEERLLIHKLDSDRHIACPMCGVEFKSEGGLNGHIQQHHRTEQTIVCCGCKSIFRSASALMRHIEDNECPKISNIRLLREQSKKIFIKEALERGQGDNLPIVPDPKDFDDIDGGVKLDPLEKANREAMVNRPKVNEEDQTESVSSLLARRHWPRIGEQPGPMGEDDDLMEFSPSRDKASKGEEGATQQETIQRGPFGINFLPDAGQTLRMLDEHWDSTKFFNSFNGKYICPGCGAGFAAMKEFEEHVLASSRGKKNVQCPGCFRTFKSTAALIAHCESPTTRCKINDAPRYGQIIDELSGGAIQISGYNEDGSIRYEAGKLEMPKTTTIGRSGHKTIW